MTIARLLSSTAASTERPVDALAPPSRVRAARLGLPRAIAELTPDDEPALASVNALVDALVELPASEWVAMGRAVVADRAAMLVRRAAWAMVDEAIADHGLGLAAWYVRDAVETVAFVASRGASHWSRADRCLFAAAHGAAEAAALALLAAPHVPGPTRDVLCAAVPFLGRRDGATAPAPNCP